MTHMSMCFYPASYAAPELSRRENVESLFHCFVSTVLDPEMKMMASGEECLKVTKVLEAIKQSAKERWSIIFGGKQ